MCLVPTKGGNAAGLEETQDFICGLYEGETFDLGHLNEGLRKFVVVGTTQQDPVLPIYRQAHSFNPAAITIVTPANTGDSKSRNASILYQVLKLSLQFFSESISDVFCRSKT